MSENGSQVDCEKWVIFWTKELFFLLLLFSSLELRRISGSVWRAWHLADVTRFFLEKNVQNVIRSKLLLLQFKRIRIMPTIISAYIAPVLRFLYFSLEFLCKKTVILYTFWHFEHKHMLCRICSFYYYYSTNCLFLIQLLSKVAGKGNTAEISVFYSGRHVTVNNTPA